MPLAGRQADIATRLRH